MGREESRRLSKKVKHNFYTKKYPSRKAREAARKLLFPEKDKRRDVVKRLVKQIDEQEEKRKDKKIKWYNKVSHKIIDAFNSNNS